MNAAIAYLIVRVALGLNIFLHGLVRINAGRQNFKASMKGEFKDTVLGGKFVGAFVLTLPLIETLIGLTLITGLLTQLAIISGSLVMLLLVTGKSVKADWQTVTFQMVYITFYAALEILIPF
jgi:thiosulfate dehydrogenase [quinone] large subunit